MAKAVENRQNGIMDSFPQFVGKEELLAKVIEFFPYPIEIYDPEGTTVLVNKAMLEEYHVSDPSAVIGKYNIFKDPVIIASGKMEVIKRAFSGEKVFFPDVKVPLEEITEKYAIKDLDLEAVYQDITVFPIFNDMNQVAYVAALLINTRVYRGKDEIKKAKEYIESHWTERFDLDKTAKAACLSKSHLAKLFRKHTGVTPYEYYVNYKIGKLMEKLLDDNLTIAQAFAACSMDYNGHSAKMFRKRVGVSPSVYRKMAK